uniref:NADH dehydrogenase subunit 2 n=1 Tax=Anagonalia emeiensis TaxID=2744606 RepID=UPI00240FAF0D|nr:NADH dehydrogenase subunit 2 [Anagonalia emeiensis]WEU75299.1 NADH dehydrogenase subunit 2 [Anagonalia emeiensis]
MHMNSSIFFFTTSMIIGVMVCISSNNWIMMWLGLEISFMSFLPLMMSSNLLSSECMMKYFIIQSLSSSILMLGMMLIMMLNEKSSFIITISLLLKIGMSPFHNWVLSIIEGLNYNSTFYLLTFMKISPLVIMSYISKIIWISIILSLIVGAILGINQNSIRKMLGYSSIFNLGFICSCISEMSLWLIYMIIYSFMLLNVILMIYKLNISYFNQIMMNEYNLNMKISFWVMMLSFSGMPPMLGFMSKLMVFEFLVLKMYFFLLMIMILTSLIVMFYYTRSTYMSMMMSSISMKWNLISINYTSVYLVMINLLILTMLIFLKPLI